MGYWNQDIEGRSFAGDGTLIWGDAPADLFGDAIRKITYRLGRPPTWPEAQQMLFAAGRELLPPHHVPEPSVQLDGVSVGLMSYAIREITDVFQQDHNREPTWPELHAGLLFSTADLADHPSHANSH